jgi:hypothetical protein
MTRRQLRLSCRLVLIALEAAALIALAILIAHLAT